MDSWAVDNFTTCIVRAFCGLAGIYKVPANQTFASFAPRREAKARYRFAAKSKNTANLN